jgi:hypothetical protein
MDDVFNWRYDFNAATRATNFPCSTFRFHLCFYKEAAGGSAFFSSFFGEREKSLNKQLGKGISGERKCSFMQEGASSEGAS